MQPRICDQWTLPNGLRIVGERLPYLRTVSIGVWMRVGSMMELPEEGGLSHFLEHMVFKGTAKRSYRDISEEMDSVGGQLDAFTTKDCTCFYAKVIDENLPLAMDILSDLTMHATLDPKEMEKERGVILEEISMDEDDPDDLAHELLAEALYGTQPVARPILGTEQQIRAYTRDQLNAFRGKHYRPESAVLALAGNYDPAEVAALAEQAFGAWKNDGSRTEIPEMTARQGMVCAKEKETEQLQLSLGYPGMRYGSEQLYALQMMNSILGGSMSSRLFQRVREELGMAYAIYSYPQCYTNVGIFGISAGVSAKNGERVLEEIAKVNRRLLAEGVTQREFDAAKAQMRSVFLMGLESPGNRMQAMGRSLLLLDRLNKPEDMIARIEAVTRDDVMDAARATLGEPACLGAAGKGAGAFASYQL